MQTNIDTTQDIITDDSLLISYTSGLQAALNNCSNNDVTLRTYMGIKQDIIADDGLLISNTSELQAALNDLSNHDVRLQNNIDA